MVQHSMEDTSHFRDEESDGRRDRETPPYLVATVRSLKVDNERLMRAQDEQEELNAVLLQSLFEIQKHLQQGPSNAELQQSERLKTPSDAQNHGLSHSNVGKSSSKKRHRMPRKVNLVEVFPQSHPVGNISLRSCPTVTLDRVSLRRKGRDIHRVL
jgi:hypothetical protein